MRGIPRTLAIRRAERIADVRYAIDAVLDREVTVLRGTIAIDFVLARPTVIRLDSRPGAGGIAVVEAVNGRDGRAVRREADHLVVPARLTRPGENRVVCRFSAPIARAGTALTRYDDREDGAVYVYSLLVPADASTVFPCFDQPDLKARFTFALAAPAGWTVVANAPLRARRRGRHEFAPTAPISTYLFAFAAGPFGAVGRRDGDGDGAVGRMFVRRSRLAGDATARRAAQETLAVSAASLDFLARYTGRSFPFPKYDLVLIPEFQYGGMEHAGATFLREDAVLLPPDASAADRLRRALLVSHENAHQWFGDLVTMRWFDDLWLKEGFANLLAAKAVAAIAPALDPRVAFVAQKGLAVATDLTRGTRPLVGPVANLLDAKAAYGAIVYQKGPAVLRMAEHLLGETVFRRGVRAWLRTHAWASADWRDLVRALEAASGRSLGRWARRWITTAELPRIEAGIATDAHGRVRRATIRQSRADGTPRAGPIAFDIAVHAAGRAPRRIAVAMDGSRVRVPALEGRPPPDALLLNAGDHAYGFFRHDRATVEHLLAMLPAEHDAVTRALVIDAAWNAMRERTIGPAALVPHLLARLREEPNETVAATMLDRLEDLVRRYLPDPDRDALLPACETTLEALAGSAPVAPMRTAFRRAFVAIAASDAGRRRLKSLLREHARGGDGTERARIVQRLAMLADPDAPALVERLARDARNDDARRWAFAAGAAWPDPAAKRAVLARFLDDPTLPERWIETALPAYAPPEHARLLLPLLARSLRALPRLERRFRIFFVNRWLAAIVASQTDPRALTVVARAAERAELSPSLRAKLLEAADESATAMRVRHRR